MSRTPAEKVRAVTDHGLRSLVLWDVDHTLVDNGGVSKENYSLAVELLTGRPPKNGARTDGRTDMLIMEDVLRDNDADLSEHSWEDQREALVRAGELTARALPSAVVR